MGGQRVLTIVDTFEQLLLECGQNHYEPSQWEKVFLFLSKVYQENCGVEKWYCFKGHQLTNCIGSFRIAEKTKSKWKGKFFIFKDENFCEFGRNNIRKISYVSCWTNFLFTVFFYREFSNRIQKVVENSLAKWIFLEDLQSSTHMGLICQTQKRCNYHYSGVGFIAVYTVLKTYTAT